LQLGLAMRSGVSSTAMPAVPVCTEPTKRNPLARNCADQRLRAAAVAESPCARRLIRLVSVDSATCRPFQILSINSSLLTTRIAVLHQVTTRVEHLRLERDRHFSRLNSRVLYQVSDLKEKLHSVCVLKKLKKLPRNAKLNVIPGCESIHYDFWFNAAWLLRLKRVRPIFRDRECVSDIAHGDRVRACVAGHARMELQMLLRDPRRVQSEQSRCGHACSMRGSLLFASANSVPQQLVDAGLGAGALVDALDDHGAGGGRARAGRSSAARPAACRAPRRHIPAPRRRRFSPLSRSTILVEAPRNTPIASTAPLRTITPFGDLRARADEAIVLDDDGLGLQRLQHAADADAAGNVHALADLRAGADRRPGVDHGRFIDIGAEIDEGRHQHDVSGDEGRAADDGARAPRESPASRKRFSAQPSNFEGTLSHHDAFRARLRSHSCR
jgi:hypothetical protein